MANRSPQRAHAFNGKVVEALQRYAEVLRQPLPRRFLVAQLLSSIGDWFNFVAVMIVASRLGVENGELAVGTALALRFVPRLIFQGPAGALTDRIRGPGLLILSQVIMGVLALSLITLQWLPHLWLLYALIFLLEATYTVSRPAFMVLLVRVVPPQQRASANGLLSIGLTAAQFVGAAVGGLVYAWTSETTLFLVNGATFLLLAALIWQIRERIPERRPAETHDDAEQPLSGYRDLTRQPSLLLYLAQQASVVILIQAATALFVTRAIELGRPVGATGIFLSMVGLGLIVGSVLGGLGAYDSRRALVVVAITEALGGIGLVIFGYADVLSVALVALILTGLTSQISDVAGTTFFQNALPDGIYGRFFSLFLLALSIGGLVGSLIGPLMARSMSTGETLALLSIPTFISSAWLAWSNRSHGQVRAQLCADMDAGD